MACLKKYMAGPVLSQLHNQLRLLNIYIDGHTAGQKRITAGTLYNKYSCLYIFHHYFKLFVVYTKYLHKSASPKMCWCLLKVAVIQHYISTLLIADHKMLLR
jgi:hypothetical protein